MIHRVKEKKLGRTAAHRKALIKNLTTSLIMHKKIDTTLAKAKYFRPFIEKLITKAKANQDFNAIKYAEKKITTETAVRALFSEVAPLYEKRQGGYTRIVKLPERGGDKAKMARIELVIDKAPKVHKSKNDTIEETASVEAKTNVENKETAKVKKVKAKATSTKKESKEIKE